MKSILLIKPHTMFRDVLAQLLSEERYQGVVADSVGDAVRANEGLDPQAVLINLDVNFEANVKDAIGMWPQAATVAFIEDFSVPDAIRVYKAGCQGIILKRSDTGEFLKALEVAVLGGTPLPVKHMYEAMVGAQAAYVPKAVGLDTYELTPRELQVAHGLLQGKLGKTISYEIGIGEGTFKTHIANLFRKTGTKNRTHLTVVLQRAVKVQKENA